MARRSSLRARILRAADADSAASHAQIAEQVGCHESTVGRHLRGRRAAAAGRHPAAVAPTLRGGSPVDRLLGPARTPAELDTKVALLSRTHQALSRQAQGEQTLLALESVCDLAESASIDPQTARGHLDTLTGNGDRSLVVLVVSALDHSRRRVAAVSERLSGVLGGPHEPLDRLLDAYTADG